MTREQLLFILNRVGALPLRLHVDYPPEDGTLELIPSTTPIHFLSLQDMDRNGIDHGRFDHLDLSQLSELDFETGYPEEILDLALKSMREELAISCYTQGGPQLKKTFAHKVINRVVRLNIEYKPTPPDGGILVR
jgi:hypothetical protein